MKKRGDNTAHQIDPRMDAHFLTGLHQLECLIEQHLSGEGIIDDFDQSVLKRESSSSGVLFHANTPSESQFKHNAPSQRIRYVVIPE
jgi:hypothetical protein